MKDPYRTEITQAREKATSDFEREVLSDGKITRTEYEEAISRYTECLDGNGVLVTLKDQNGYYVYSVDGSGNADKYDTYSIECAKGTTAVIEGLYVDRLVNPQNIDPNQNVVNCLKRKKLVPEIFTKTDYTAALTAQQKNASADSSAQDVAVDFNDQRVIDCVTNPAAP